MNKTAFEIALAELPLYAYFYADPKKLDFSQRVRQICRSECPRYGKSWACPPGVGSVSQCQERCLRYQYCLVVGTIAECDDISNIQVTLATRQAHEAVTNQVRQLLRQQGTEPYVLSTDSCAICAECTYTQGKPCCHPEAMYPCIESHGINIIPTLEDNGLAFQYGSNMITWYSMFFFNEA